MHRAGCELRRSPGLADEFGPEWRAFARPSRDDAWLFPCGPYRAGQTIRRSDLRSLDSAVQSRVGDGFLAERPDGSDSQAQPDWGLPVFPSTKFAVNVRGGARCG
jgi:hypothetical protein